MTKKISQLGAAGALTGAELLEVTQGGASKRSTASLIAALGNAYADAAAAAAEASSNATSAATYLPLAGGTMTGAILSSRAAAADDAYRTRVNGDAFDRLTVNADGSMFFGGGAAGQDVAVSWNGVGGLLIDASAQLDVSGRLSVAASGTNTSPGVQVGATTVGLTRPGTAQLGIITASGIEPARFRSTGLEVMSTGAPGTVEKFRVGLPATVDNAATTILTAGAAGDRALVVQMAASATAAPFVVQNSAGSSIFTMGTAGNFVLSDAATFALGTTTGLKIGTATSQKLAFWNKAPIVQPTNGIAAAAFVANTSGIANDTATFGGYTIGKIAAALIAVGILT